MNSLKAHILQSINEITASEWNACVNADEPFARHEFLASLEDSECVAPTSGWMPQHMVLRDEGDELLACCPMYLKSHSYGEYVFDWSWADAYERAGGRYYPKLQCAIPFTPVTGNRILLHKNATEEHQLAMLGAMRELAQKLQVSSLHVTFAEKTEWDLMKNSGYLPRVGHQYHWENKGYKTFDDFLAQMSSRKRKSIKKERRSLQDSDIEIKTFSGSEITEEHWDAFYRFYLDTSGRKWGHAYLNRNFFTLLGQRLGENVVLVLAFNDGNAVAGALNLKGDQTLYGRYWGCLEDYRFLHFEACYYQAIEYAIENGLQRVEAGAQGQHKIQRGYLPVETYSAHWIADPSFANAVSDFLDHDKRVNQLEMIELSKLSPYKQDNSVI